MVQPNRSIVSRLTGCTLFRFVISYLLNVVIKGECLTDRYSQWMMRSIIEDSLSASSSCDATHFILPPWRLLSSASSLAQVSVLIVTCTQRDLLRNPDHQICHKTLVECIQIANGAFQVMAETKICTIICDIDSRSISHLHVN